MLTEAEKPSANQNVITRSHCACRVAVSATNSCVVDCRWVHMATLLAQCATNYSRKNGSIKHHSDKTSQRPCKGKEAVDIATASGSSRTQQRCQPEEQLRDAAPIGQIYALPAPRVVCYCLILSISDCNVRPPAAVEEAMIEPKGGKECDQPDQPKATESNDSSAWARLQPTREAVDALVLIEEK